MTTLSYDYRTRHFQMYGLEGRNFHPNPFIAEYNLVYISERLGCSCADFNAINDFIVAWNIAVHDK